ncbi:MAG: UvrD-helicase domain-containing protein, partial [Victivallaceae bacterium]|nr:UvrD-helicase domain-containing protein [Victivallaceae bacterium]
MYNDFQKEIFHPDFPLQGAHLIAASAGTGKTYQIQNLYARLILEQGLRVSEILVMTFTKAATLELKQRIRRVLEDLRKRLAVPPEKADDNERADALIACARRKEIPQQEMRARTELALLEFDRAAISTIHGFCERTLARYAFESGFRFDSPLQNSLKDKTLHCMVRDWYLAFGSRNDNGFSLEELDAAVRELG